jgi:energy-converting hydrogenase Eha subunit A
MGAESSMQHGRMVRLGVKDRIVRGLFSLSGVAMMVAVAGFLSAIVTMFIDVGTVVPTRALLLTVFLSTCLIVVLLKIIHDLANVEIPPSPFEHPIKYLHDEQIFIIRRNENFLNHIVVGCYFSDDDVDRLAYLAVVHLMQEKVIQIKIHADLGVLKSVPRTSLELRALVIRPVVPVTAIQLLQNGELT